MSSVICCSCGRDIGSQWDEYHHLISTIGPGKELWRRIGGPLNKGTPMEGPFVCCRTAFMSFVRQERVDVSLDGIRKGNFADVKKAQEVKVERSAKMEVSDSV